MKKIFKITTAVLSVVLLTACSSSNGEKKEVPKVVRVAEYPNDFYEQQRIYEDRKNEQEATKWGQAESGTWNQRYRSDEDPYTYQGNIK